MTKRGRTDTVRVTRRVQTAFNKYVLGSITLPKAAEIAGISIYEMIDLLEERRIPYRYDLSELEEYVKRRYCQNAADKIPRAYLDRP